jgi:hypothetical protein
MRSPISDQDRTLKTVNAEIACIRGDAATLAQYLRQTAQPSFDVIQNIAACLLANLPGNDLGPGDWKLTFSIKNGRPPKHFPAIDSAALAVAHGQAIPLGRYLQAMPNIDTATLLALADALDPETSPVWRLKFSRTRPGFYRSRLGNDLRIIYRDNEFRRLRSEGKLGKQISHEMGASATTLKKAARAMKKTARKPPNKVPNEERD